MGDQGQDRRIGIGARRAGDLLLQLCELGLQPVDRGVDGIELGLRAGRHLSLHVTRFGEARHGLSNEMRQQCQRHHQQHQKKHRDDDHAHHRRKLPTIEA
jgi:hypothetical protein